LGRRSARRSSSAKAGFRVLDVVPFGEEDEPPFVGLLRVEAI